MHSYSYLSLAQAVTALGLLSSTTESFAFAPRSLAGTRAESQSQSHHMESPSALFVSVSESLSQQTTVAAVPKVAQRWRKSTKQLATLGPSSCDKEMIEKVCTYQSIAVARS
jgi:hypothetical protein